MYKINFLFYVLLIVFGNTTISFAQPKSITGVEAFRNLTDLSQVRTYDMRYEGVHGSVYISNWEEGSFIANNNDIYIKIPIRWNVFENGLMVKKPSGDSILIDADKIISFQTESQGKFVKVPQLANNNPAETNRLYQIVYEGKITLYKRYKKELLKADYKGAYSSGRTYDEFVDRIAYFIKKSDGSFVEAKPNEKSLAEAYPGKESAVEGMLKSKKLKIKTEKDFIEAAKEADLL